MVDGVKQVLACENCDEFISTPVHVQNTTTKILDELRFGFRDDLVPDGICYVSSKSLIELSYEHYKDKVRNTQELVGNWAFAAKKRLAKIEYSDSQTIDLNWVDTFEIALSGPNGNVYAPKAYMLHFTPQCWMNTGDLIYYQDDHIDEFEHGYCCGPTGFYGPNFKCVCEAYIGTICLECNAPEVFIPDPKTTYWKNEE